MENGNSVRVAAIEEFDARAGLRPAPSEIRWCAFRGCALRPLTPRRILAVCGLLLAVLFVVVVISLRMGAYPISVQRNCDDAFPRRGGTARADSFGILAGGFWAAAAANRAGNFGRRGAFDGGRRFSGAAAKSARRSVRAGRFERSGAGSDREFGDCAARAGLDSARGVCGGGSDDHGGLFSGAARRTTRQPHAAAGGNRVGVVFVGDHHVFDDDAERARSCAGWRSG